MKKSSIENLIPRTNDALLLAISGLTAIIFVEGLLNSRAAADDYCFGNSVENFGILGSLGSYIFGWTPTYSSYAFVHYFLAIFNSPTSLIIGLILGNTMFFLLCFLTLLKTGVDRQHSKNVFLVLFMFQLVWISGSYSGQNLLWYSFFWISTLAVHTFPFALGTWLFLNIKDLSLKILIVLLLVLGGMGFAETAGWSITYFTIALIQRIYLNRGWNSRLLLASILLFGITLISYKMPGTGKRAALMNSIRGHKLEINLPDLFQSFIQYSKKHASEVISVRGFVAALLAGLLITALLKNSSKINVNYIVAFTFLVGTLQLFMAALAGVFSYFAPWHGTSTSISWSICATFIFVKFWQRILPKLKNHIIFSLSLVATLLLGTMSAVFTNALVGNIGARSVAWDKRWVEGSSIPVPAIDINGQNLVEDTESSWVKNCYSGWRD